jgi:gamma-glutamyltranspeptidase/glutathione hydrolase
MDTSGERHAGVITAHDMSQWRAGVEAPSPTASAATRVLKCGPWSQGPAMLQTLALLDGFDLAADGPRRRRVRPPRREAMKLAFADREAFYGDPAFTDVPMQALLSDAYTAERRKLMGAQASMEFRPGRPEGREARGVDYPAAIRRAEEMQAAAGSGEPTVSRLGAAGGDTCHVDIIDRHGNFVSATPSAGWLQSSPAIPSWASASARAARCSGWTRRCPTGCSPASGRAPPSRPRLCCATAGLG